MKSYKELTEKERKEFGYPELPMDESEKKSTLAFTDWALDNKVQFLESEKRVYSEEWFVAGTADFTCVIGDQRFVGDLKTMKQMWDRTPFFQCAAYLKMFVEMGDDSFDGTIIVNINKENNKLTEYKSFDFETDIKSFEAALTLYKSIKL